MLLPGFVLRLAEEDIFTLSNSADCFSAQALNHFVGKEMSENIECSFYFLRCHKLFGVLEK